MKQLNTKKSQCYAHTSKDAYTREIFVYGDTFPHKEALKERGFTYTPEMPTPNHPESFMGKGWEHICPFTEQAKHDALVAWIEDQGWSIRAVGHDEADPRMIAAMQTAADVMHGIAVTGS